MSKEVKTLGEVADFINGLAFKPSDWEQEGKRIIRIQNLTNPDKPFNKTSRPVDPKYIVRKGDLLVSWSASLGVFEWNNSDDAVLNQHIFKVVPKIEMDKSYLRHSLQQAVNIMDRYTHGSTMKHINREEFLATQIPWRKIEEQRRIASILDKADAIRRKRRQAIDLMNDFLRSVFLEMFGDEEANGPFIPLCDAVEIVSGQVDPRVSPYSKMLLIGGENIEGGTGKLLNLNTAEEARAISGKYLFSSDCILYSKIRPYLNKVVLPDFSGICSADIYPIVPKKEFSKEFVAFALQTTRFLSYAESCSTRTSIPKINREDLGNYSLSMPSIEKQNKFSQIYTGTKRCSVSLARSEKEIENCFNALTSNIF